MTCIITIWGERRLVYSLHNYFIYLLHIYICVFIIKYAFNNDMHYHKYFLVWNDSFVFIAYLLAFKLYIFIYIHILFSQTCVFLIKIYHCQNTFGKVNIYVKVYIYVHFSIHANLWIYVKGNVCVKVSI